MAAESPSGTQNIQESQLFTEKFHNLLMFRKTQQHLPQEKNTQGQIASPSQLNRMEWAILLNDACPDGSCSHITPLAVFGLCKTVAEVLFPARRVTSLYDWQSSFLATHTFQKNTILNMSTSAGKTLVADFVILKTLFELGKNALLVLHFRSLVEEKVKQLNELSAQLGFLVEVYAGNLGRYPPRQSARSRIIYVGTIEKCVLLVDCLTKHGRLEQLGCVVFDEIQIMHDEDRGLHLESIMTTLMMERCRSCSPTVTPSTQAESSNDTHYPHIIAMSATIGNVQELKSFLQAELFAVKFRPISVEEFGVCDGIIQKAIRNEDDPHIPHIVKGVVVKNVNSSYNADQKARDPSFLAYIVQEAIHKSKSVLVFNATKKDCEVCAALLLDMLKSVPDLPLYQLETLVLLQQALAEEMVVEGNEVLLRAVEKRIAIHHAGLTSGQRILIERSFSAGLLLVLCCTSTLAAGVNLPASVVIIRGVGSNQNALKVSAYHQMIGRAGRCGFSQSGQSYLLYKSSERVKANAIIQGHFEPCNSNMLPNNFEGLKTTILKQLLKKTCITNEPHPTSVTQLTFVLQLVEKTLLFHQFERLHLNLSKVVEEVLQALWIENAIKFEISNGNIGNIASMKDAHVTNTSGGPGPSTENIVHIGKWNEHFTLAMSDESRLGEVKELQLRQMADVHENSQVVRLSTRDNVSLTPEGQLAISHSMSVPQSKQTLANLQLCNLYVTLNDVTSMLYILVPVAFFRARYFSMEGFTYLIEATSSLEWEQLAKIGLNRGAVETFYRQHCLKVMYVKVDIMEVPICKFYVAKLLSILLQDVTQERHLTHKFKLPLNFFQETLSAIAREASTFGRYASNFPDMWLLSANLHAISKKMSVCLDDLLADILLIPGMTKVHAVKILAIGCQNMHDVAQLSIAKLRATLQVPFDDPLPKYIIQYCRRMMRQHATYLSEEAYEFLLACESDGE